MRGSRVWIALLAAWSVTLPGCDPAPETWYTGNFRFLQPMSAELVGFVDALPHPNQGAYGKLSSTRRARFTALLDALFAATDASLADPNQGDWCGVNAAAATAGYAIRRFYDTGSGRWLVYGFDTTGLGQA